MQEHDDAHGRHPRGDDGPLELIRPEDFLARNRMPHDAQRMGVDRWSDEAGLIAVAAALDPAKRWHRVAAWVMLIAITLPLALNLVLELTYRP